MKTGLKVAVVLGLVMVGMLVFNYAIHLTNNASDISVAAGVGILLVYVAIAVALGIFVFRKIENAARQNLDRLGMFFAVIFVGASCMLTTGCGTTVEPGHVGIKINKWGTYRGVQDLPLQTGWVSYNYFTEDVLQYPVFVQRVVWTENTSEGKPQNEEILYNSRDELVFKADISASYELIADKVPHFYMKFRNDDVNAFTHGFFRDRVRDALNEVATQYTADELYGEKKTEFLKKAEDMVRLNVEPIGVHLIALGYTSSPRPPEQVATAINNKITAIQKAIQSENELRQTEAEAKKNIANAHGQAMANQELTKSLTPELLEWRKLDLQSKGIDVQFTSLAVQDRAIARWNGGLPMYTGGAIPFLQLAPPQSGSK